MLFFLIIFFATRPFTEQVPDVLIIDEKLYYLKSFPLDDLQLTMKEPLSDSTEISTACWRGYQATWEVRNDSLFLINMTKCHSDKNITIRKYFEERKPKIKTIENDFFAYWYNAELVNYEYIGFGGRPLQNYLWSITWRELHEDEKVILSFKNGILTRKQ